jgi:sortase A
MMSRARLIWIERLLFAGGVVCLGWYGYASTSAAVRQHEQQTAFLNSLVQTPAARADEAPSAAPGETGTPSHDAGDPPGVALPLDEEWTGPLGLLEIPRLGVSATVMSGDDEEVLAAAAGHLPDTPRPWEAGNSAIAAHRDGLFRPLKRIRRGDVIRLRTSRGDLEYRVDELRIVMPTDLSVLEPRESDSITLITCYPFNYVGAAPKRFIVHAERIGGSAASAGLLPSRSLAVFASYSASPRRDHGSSAATRRSTALGVRHAQLARSRAPRAERVSSRAGRPADRRADRATAPRDRRQQDTATGSRRQGPQASRGDRPQDDRPRKTRRWFHFFKRRG